MLITVHWIRLLLGTALAGTAWVSCNSWYRHPETGRIPSNWPSDTDAYARRVRDLVDTEFVFT